MFSPIRTTDYSAAQLTVDNLDTQLSSIQRLQQEGETGKRILQPSDDPSGTINAMSLRSQINRYNGYAGSAADGQDWLNQADSALQGVTTVLNDVYSATESGANQSAGDPTSRAALAAKVGADINTILGAANTVYNGQYLFGGNQVLSGGSVPYETSANGSITYNGNTSTIFRQVGPGPSGLATVSVSGASVFGSGVTVSTTTPPTFSGTGVFTVLSQIKSDLVSNPNNLKNDLGALHDVMTNVSAQNGVLGALSSQLQTTSTQLSSKLTSLQGSLGSVEDADMTQVLTSVQLQETAYQVALQTAAKVVQPTLANFLG